MASISSTIPVLASLNIDQSRQFYAAQLGFACQQQTPGYLIMARDGCELHFWLCTDRRIAQNTSCYVRGDTAALHADFVQRGLSIAPPVVCAWGMKEVYVIDPHGNLLKFGEPA